MIKIVMKFKYLDDNSPLREGLCESEGGQGDVF